MNVKINYEEWWKRTWHLESWSKNCSFNGERGGVLGKFVRWSSRRNCCKRSIVFNISSIWELGPRKDKFWNMKNNFE